MKINDEAIADVPDLMTQIRHQHLTDLDVVITELGFTAAEIDALLEEEDVE